MSEKSFLVCSQQKQDVLVDCRGYINLCQRHVVCKLGERINVADLAEELGTARDEKR